MGLPKEMVIGVSFSEFQKRVPNELAEIYYIHDRELLENGGSHYYETRVICADGVIRDFPFPLKLLTTTVLDKLPGL